MNTYQINSFLISPQKNKTKQNNIFMGIHLIEASYSASNKYPKHMFLWEKYQYFLVEISTLSGTMILNGGVFLVIISVFCCCFF